MQAQSSAFRMIWILKLTYCSLKLLWLHSIETPWLHRTKPKKILAWKILGFLVPRLFKVVAPLARRPGGERLVVGVLVPGQGDDGGHAQREGTASSSLGVHLKREMSLWYRQQSQKLNKGLALIWESEDSEWQFNRVSHLPKNSNRKGYMHKLPQEPNCHPKNGP